MCIYVDTYHIQKSVYGLWENFFFLLILIAVSYDINNQQSDFAKEKQEALCKVKAIIREMRI